MNFGSVLKRYRIYRRINQTQLARAVGVTQQCISKIEKGITTEISFIVALRLSDELGWPLEEMAVFFK